MSKNLSDLEIVARIAEGRILKAVVSWAFALIAGLGFVGRQTGVRLVENHANAYVDSVVATSVDSEALAQVVERQTDSTVIAQLVRVSIDSIVERRIEELDADKLAELQPDAEIPILSINDSIEVEVSDSLPVVTFSITVPSTGRFRIGAQGQGSLDPVIALVLPAEDGAEEPNLIYYDDDGGEGLDSLMDVELNPGSYELWISGFGGSAGVATITFTDLDQ